jgi:voltage-dependent calcium channel
MASNNPQTPNPSTPQSIPLQDLSRPPDSEDVTDGSHRRGRSSSGGERTPGIRKSLIGRGFGRAYERIAESSPSPSDRNRLNPPRPASISTQHGPSPYMEDDRSASPLDDLGGFHAAMSSVGLSFGPPMPATPHAAPVPIDEDRGQPRIVIEDEDLPDSRRQVTSSDSDYFLPTETDTTPLTDNRHVQPISGASASTPRGQRHDRTSVHFVDGPSPGSHLGDDLPNLESGLHPNRSRSILGRGRSSSDRSRSRSISPSASTSPLSRAGSMMRMMSQRVVNLSNDPETVDQTIRRKSSLKQARLDTPPSFPAMNEYAHDEPHDFDGQNGYGFKPPEKDEPVMLSVRQKKLQAQLNPLRGDSLMIFSPENKLRKKLLEFLVHPAMEPVILILILIQTVLLAVDSAPSVYTDPRSKRWGSSKIDYAMFGLYVIYTVEVFVRIIVSGFLFNPSEYSTLDRAHGLRKAILGKSQTLFAPVRQPSKKRPNAMEAEPQLSVLRSFTGFQEPVEQTGHGRQQQRIRLARRAFLRHSYNRIDFVAVVSFWVSFALAIEGVESKKHIYVFKMLSCLRLIRLLGLTSGTSVSVSVPP